MELPLTEIRGTPFAPVPPWDAFEALRESVRAHGVIIPIMVRLAPQDWMVREGRRNNLRGWFCLRAGLIDGKHYRGPSPPFYDSESAARKALPTPKPYEVLPGHGNLRLLAAKAVKLKTVEVFILEHSDEQTLELARFDVLHATPIR